MPGWTPVIAVDALPPGAIAPAGDDWVVWRTRSGALATLPRRCPHLDSDLLEGRVVGEELICATHEWCFDVDGHAGKRNEWGRLDRKDDVTTLPVREHDGVVEVRT